MSFYSETKGDFREFSNYFGKKQDKNYKLVIDGKNWQTTEHYFQSQKFSDTCYSEIIRNAKTPNIARILALQKTGGGYKWRTDLNPIIIESKEKGIKIREDWEEIKEEIMYKTVKEKFLQNEHLKAKLLGTENTPIIEESPRDSFWGIGKDKKGLNKLGKIIEKIRYELK